jgi:hypothetical protein
LLPVVKTVRFVLLAGVAALAATALGTSHATAAARMPIGFFDDQSFRWAPEKVLNLQKAADAGATVIHTQASWPAIAPTKPTDPSDGDDPVYRLADLDDLVTDASADGIRVMIDITGTPKWANGGKSPNHLPKKLTDLTTFAKMLATRYNGHHGHG